MAWRLLILFTRLRLILLALGRAYLAVSCLHITISHTVPQDSPKENSDITSSAFFSFRNETFSFWDLARADFLWKTQKFWKILGNFWKFLKKSGMKNMKLPKTPKNGGLPQDFFRRAKRAGKSSVPGNTKKHWSGCELLFVEILENFALNFFRKIKIIFVNRPV